MSKVWEPLVYMYSQGHRTQCGKICTVERNLSYKSTKQIVKHADAI